VISPPKTRKVHNTAPPPNTEENRKISVVWSFLSPHQKSLEQKLSENLPGKQNLNEKALHIVKNWRRMRRPRVSRYNKSILGRHFFYPKTLVTWFQQKIWKSSQFLREITKKSWNGSDEDDTECGDLGRLEIKGPFWVAIFSCRLTLITELQPAIKKALWYFLNIKKKFGIVEAVAMKFRAPELKVSKRRTEFFAVSVLFIQVWTVAMWISTT
jgi:hypothetical protein